MENVFLSISNISKTYPGVKALDGINLNVERGTIHAICGENGAGKSTLIKILSGVETPDPGAEILLEGERLNNLSVEEFIDRGISVIYQDISLFSNLTVAENICFGRKKLKGVNWKNYAKIAREALEMIHVDIDVNTKLEFLSIAKQQLVAIARAVSTDCKLLIMDEPTASLSTREVELLFKIVDELRAKGMTILFISHKLYEVRQIADRLSVIRDGRLIGSMERADFNDAEIIRMMVGRDFHYTRMNEKSFATDEVVLEARKISKAGNYRDISLKLHKGEVLGITGLVGSGRSETVQAFFGMNPCEEGEILVHGKPVKLTSPKDAIRIGISYIPEHRQLQGLVMQLPLTDNVAIPNLPRVSKKGFIDRKKTAQEAQQTIDELSIRPAQPEKSAMFFSGGNQQKIVIGKWLRTNSDILLVDEPTIGVDVGAKQEIHRIIRQLAEAGKSILVISSELEEIISISDRILIMRAGKIVRELVTNETDQEEIMHYAISGS